MIVIVGLGNPGKEYEKTKHNIGFLFLDMIQTDWKFPKFHLDKHFTAEISKGTYEGQDILLVKPQTFMNVSGQAVLSIQQFYKLQPENFWIVYDELDLPWGKIRIRTEGSSAGHNGIKSIIAALGSEQFHRFRIGIQPEHFEPGQERQGTVLSKFTKEEQKQMVDIFEQVEEEMKTILNSKF
ncbi:MAG TPA: aminoacyl-tRNA hydrolase [Chryseolinea sp.]|uniref:Peptidyl-tRNA hydrolase n=1 Tax=Candidatus Abawacabacteria bacterium RBG_16_42_10 TaxID=1817814 RepID=A0A1F4XKM4_9BACT|nr:MAG: aminoacyl-tRNA hydrolase [Candidatus Abawacabacteria bacterium RBG_16_42_10]HKZ37406.1 aminoacyl-tRNA hydrolase [Chryseolinea sp.]HLG41615.1 aminoacyl-tRNA hydrolase [Chitinophagaceae bacterium]